MTLVFQYGSNVDAQRLNSAARLAGAARPLGLVRTRDDHELEFTVWSDRNGCAAAAIRRAAGGRPIWGALYDVPAESVARDSDGASRSLDEIENVGVNYVRAAIRVVRAGGSPVRAPVLTYLPRSPADGLRTSAEYVGHILRGLLALGAPADYVAYVVARARASDPALDVAPERLAAAGLAAAALAAPGRRPARDRPPPGALR